MYQKDFRIHHKIIGKSEAEGTSGGHLFRHLSQSRANIKASSGH